MLLSNVQMTPQLIAAFVVFALAVVASIFELVFCFLEMEKGRILVKPFCLLLVGIGIVLAAPQAWLLYCGAFFGFLGDILLIYKDKKPAVLAGIGIFLVGHFFYICGMFSLLPNGVNGIPNFYLYASITVLGTAILMFPIVYFFTKKNLLMSIAGSIYFSFLLMNPISAITVAVIGGMQSTMIITFAGGLMFVLSDVILSYTLFQKDIKRRDFYIMSTYIAGQSLICLGFLLTILK